MIYRIREVVNYGGFFAGDTVTVSAHANDKPDEELTLTIDQGTLTNVDDRFQIVAGMALDVKLEGEHVVSAALLAAPERAVLRKAVSAANHKDPSPKSQDTNPAAPEAPRIFSHYCAKCNLWILGAPRDGKCGVEGHELKPAA
jgi:hypothetical protein